MVETMNDTLEAVELDPITKEKQTKINRGKRQGREEEGRNNYLLMCYNMI